VSSGKVIIIAAPSGAGKTTIAAHMLAHTPCLRFSVSATTRKARSHETHGKDYFFLSESAFQEAIAEGRFVEWEEVYPGSFYGTLKTEVERIWAEGNHVVFDVDVKGALSLKHIFGDKALALFIMPPSVDVLEKRLRLRASDSDDAIKIRVKKAFSELNYYSGFDVLIFNDNLDVAKQRTLHAVSSFLE
jgi:guanylate kinase